MQAIRCATVLLIPLVLMGCASQPSPGGYGVPGFFSGILHGFLMPFSLVGSIVMDIRIYAYPNSGGWYDLGYFLGVCIIAGSAESQAKK